MKRNKRTTLVVVIGVLVTIFTVSSCVTGVYGHLKRSTSLTESIERAEVSTEYNYYYSGSPALPEAVIGIKKQYILDGRFWKPIELNSEILKNWVNFNGSYRRASIAYTYFGHYMYGPDGQEIGIWYGYQDFATIKQQDKNTYRIYTPPMRHLARKTRFLFN